MRISDEKHQENLRYLLGLDKKSGRILDEAPREYTDMLVKQKKIKEFFDKLKFWDRKKDEEDNF